MNTDNAEVNFQGNKASFSRAGSAGNYFFYLIGVLGVLCFLFSWVFYTLMPFYVFIMLAIPIIIFSLVRFHKHSEDFQSHEAWTAYKKLFFGDMQNGLHASSVDEEQVQPILIGKPISDRKSIKKGNTK